MSRINRLLSIMSTFKPVKKELTGIKIWYVEPCYYFVNIELNSKFYVHVPITISFLSYEDNAIKQYLHDELNKEIAKDKDE